MFRIIYISGETSHFTRPRLEELLVRTRTRNAELGITGLLLYKHGNFLQVLEGEEAVVRQLFQTISQDPRHRRVIPVLQESIEARSFPAWSMAFEEIEEPSVPEQPGFSRFFQIPWDAGNFDGYSDTIRRFLKVFVLSTT